MPVTLEAFPRRRASVGAHVSVADPGGVVDLDKPFLPPVTVPFVVCPQNIFMFCIFQTSKVYHLQITSLWGNILDLKMGLFTNTLLRVIPYLCLLTESIQTSWICLCVLKLTPTFHLYMPSTVVVVSW